jgi:hypothetical protein
MYRLTREKRRGVYVDCQSIAQSVFSLVTARS